MSNDAVPGPLGAGGECPLSWCTNGAIREEEERGPVRVRRSLDGWSYPYVEVVTILRCSRPDCEFRSVGPRRVVWGQPIPPQGRPWSGPPGKGVN